MLRSILYIVLLSALCREAAMAQVSLSAPSATVTENFNSMGTGTALPANWKMSAANGGAANWNTGTNVSSVTQTACGTNPTAGGRYNWGMSAACTDRAVGFMTSGSYSSANSIFAWYRNTSGSVFNDITITFDLEQYRQNTNSFSLAFFTSTDGTTWTAQTAGDAATGVFATGASAYTFSSPFTVSRTVTLTGINLANNSDLYLKWVFTTPGSSNSQGIGLDNVSVTGSGGTTCTSASEPATAASALTFTNVGCNSITLSWTNGDGSKRLVAARAGAAITGTPADQQVYSANATFGSGSTIAANEYVVYNGTGSTVTVAGLNGGTTYHFTIFEYNGAGCPASGENYLATSVTTGSHATTGPCVLPQLTGVLINACGTSASCQEGDNEILFLNSGSYTIPVSAANIIVRYGSSFPPATTYTDGFTTNATAINSMNSAAGCGTLFYDASITGSIPANSAFLIMKSTACYSYDFSAFCGTGPVYVLFSSDADWGASGNFANSGTAGSLRYFRTDFTAVTGVSSVIDYNYEPDQLASSGDGDAVTFSAGGGPASSYINNGCNPSPIILPIELISFTAAANDNEVTLEWVTASELNNDYFTIERTRDGSSYEKVIIVDGAGTTAAIHSYSAKDLSPLKGTSYYRLKQTDFDGKYSYSQLAAVHNGSNDYMQVIYNSEENVLTVHSDAGKDVCVDVIDMMGRTVYQGVLPGKSASVKIRTELFNQGIYIVRVNDGKQVFTQKIWCN